MSRNFENPKLNTKPRSLAVLPSVVIPGKVQQQQPHVLKAVNSNPGIKSFLRKTKKSAPI